MILNILLSTTNKVATNNNHQQLDCFTNRKNMYNHSFLKKATKNIYIFSRVLALRPFDIDSDNKVVQSNFNTIYAIAFNVFVIYFYLKSISLYKNLIHYQNDSTNGATTKSMFYSNIIVFVTIYVFQNIYKKNIQKVLTKIKKFIGKTAKISNEIQISYKSALSIYCVKSLSMKIALILSAFTGVKNAIDGNFFNAIMIVIPIIVIFSVSNFIYAINVAVRFYFTIFNRKMENILQEIRLLKGHKEISLYGRIKLHCEFSDQIDEIAIFHGELCDIAKMCVEIYQIPVFCTILNIFASLVAQSFHNYLDYSGSFTYGGEAKAGGRMGSILYILVGLFDLLMQVDACKACVTEVNIICCK